MVDAVYQQSWLFASLAKWSKSKREECMWINQKQIFLWHTRTYSALYWLYCVLGRSVTVTAWQDVRILSISCDFIAFKRGLLRHVYDFVSFLLYSIGKSCSGDGCFKFHDLKVFFFSLEQWSERVWNQLLTYLKLWATKASSYQTLM